MVWYHRIEMRIPALQKQLLLAEAMKHKAFSLGLGGDVLALGNHGGIKRSALAFDTSIFP